MYNDTFAHGTDTYACPMNSNCIYALPQPSACDWNASPTDVSFTVVQDGSSDSIAWAQDIAYPVGSVMFWLGDILSNGERAQNITFHSVDGIEIGPIFTRPYYWTCAWTTSNSHYLATYQVNYI